MPDRFHVKGSSVLLLWSNRPTYLSLNKKLYLYLLYQTKRAFYHVFYVKLISALSNSC